MDVAKASKCSCDDTVRYAGRPKNGGVAFWADDSADEQTLVVNVTVERRQPDVDAPRDDKTLQHITWIDVESSAHESYAISCIRS